VTTLFNPLRLEKRREIDEAVEGEKVRDTAFYGKKSKNCQ
jgi:hypothetical protein